MLGRKGGGPQEIVKNHILSRAPRRKTNSSVVVIHQFHLPSHWQSHCGAYGTGRDSPGDSGSETNSGLRSDSENCCHGLLCRVPGLGSWSRSRWPTSTGTTVAAAAVRVPASQAEALYPLNSDLLSEQSQAGHGTVSRARAPGRVRVRLAANKSRRPPA